MMAFRFNIIVANVLTFIPPAVDWDAPPIHIRNRNISMVTFRNETGLTDEKPEERGTEELNHDCTTLCHTGIPSRVLSYSNRKNSNVDTKVRIREVTSTILVLRS